MASRWLETSSASTALGSRSWPDPDSDSDDSGKRSWSGSETSSLSRWVLNRGDREIFFFDHGKLGCCLVFGTRAEGSEG
jgi:hypothetical protein